MNILSVVEVAKVCHEANRAYAAALGDNSNPPWEDSPEWQRLSVCEGVRYRLRHPTIGAAAMHEHWLKEKLQAGWRWGTVKDADAKTHPCCVPYEDLPIAERAKDYLFKAVVDALSGLVMDTER